MSEPIAEIEARVADHAKLLTEHGRRLTDVETATGSHSQLIAVLQQNIAMQNELAEVGRALIKALGWVGTAARWLASVAGACAIVYGLLKALLRGY